MKLTSIRCPSCGGGLRIPPDRDFIFCTYCGSQIHYDDGVARCEVTHRYIDEARLRELDLLERQMLEEAAEPDDDPDEAADSAEDGPEDAGDDCSEKFRYWFECLSLWLAFGALLFFVRCSWTVSDSSAVKHLAEAMLPVSLMIGSVALTPMTCRVFYGAGQEPSPRKTLCVWAALLSAGFCVSALLGLGLDSFLIKWKYG